VEIREAIPQVDKLLIAEMAVEGGGITIFGSQSEGIWSFRTEGRSLDVDENDDEVWRSWSSEKRNTRQLESFHLLTDNRRYGGAVNAMQRFDAALRLADEALTSDRL
jgi:hypothetical protein